MKSGRPCLSGWFAWASLTLIVLLALALRLYRLGELPPGLFPDEALNGVQAMEALHSGRFRVFYPENGGREGLMIALQALSFALAGISSVTLRLPSAFLGALSVAGVFLATRKMAGFFLAGRPAGRSLDPNAFALLTAFFVATSHWHVNFSRTAFRGILDPFFSPLALFALVSALERRAVERFALAGGITSLGLYGYSSHRFLLFPILALLFIDAARHGRGLAAAVAGRLRDRGWWAFAACAAAVAAPLLHVAVTQPAQLFARARSVSVLAAERPWHEFALSAEAAALQFFTRGDANWRHNIAGQPALPAVLAVSFATGLLLIVLSWAPAPLRRLHGSFGAPIGRILTALRHWMPPELGAVLAVWLLAMLLPAALTREGRPHFLRSIGAIPPVYAIAALGILAVFRATAVALPGRLGTDCQLLATGALAALLFRGTYIDYFLRWGRDPGPSVYFHTYAGEHASWIDALPRDAEKYVVCDWCLGGEREVHRAWEFQPVVFYTRTETEAARRTKGVRYLRRQELDALNYSEAPRHFFLAECPRELIEKEILAKSPNAVIR